MKVTPLGHNILVRAEAKKERKVGEVYVPDTAQEQTLMGEVVAVGAGKRLEDGSTRKMTVKAGDKVIYKYGAAIKVDDEELLMMTEDDIFGTVEE